MEETIATQSEIVRLNRIITILIDQIEFLKQENSFFRRNNGNIKKKSSAVIPDNGNMLNNPSAYTSDSGNNLNKPSAVVPHSGNMLNNPSAYTSDSGNNLNKPSAVMSEGGHSANNTSTVTPVSAPLPPAVMANRHTPVLIEYNPKNERLLSARLKKFFHVRIKEKSLCGLARELLVMHNNGFADSKELRKATGLTESGFAKHFPMIKRKGWVYKQGVRKYALTPSAMALVDEVFGVEKN